MPQRSFFVYAYQFPLCARCTGIFVGKIIAIFLLVAGCRPFTWTAILCMLPMVADGGIQLLCERYESTNGRRLITGILFGIALIFLLFQIISIFL